LSNDEHSSDTFENKREKKTRKNFSFIRKTNLRWVISMLICAFVISMIFTYASTSLLTKADIIAAFLILAFFILLGIVFDIIGIASASANETPFHSMAARKIHGASHAVWIIRNADKVTSFCNDVVGDISGIISGATGAAIVAQLAGLISVGSIWTQLVITALIAAVTIGGKAFGKGIAISYSNDIVFAVGKILYAFSKAFGKGDK